MSLLQDLIRGPAPRKVATDTLAQSDTDALPEALTVSKVSSLSVSTSGRSRETGALWDAADWQAHYDERAAIIEFDGGFSRSEAELRALDCCVTEWLNRNPARSPPGRCLACGDGEACEALVPIGTENAGHVWLHSRCWPGWYAGRRAQAATALGEYGVHGASTQENIA